MVRIQYLKYEDRLKELEYFGIHHMWIFGLERMRERKVHEENWEEMGGLIEEFMKKSHESYARELIEASIFYAITALEYSLRIRFYYKLLEAGTPKEQIEKLLNRQGELRERSFNDVINQLRTEITFDEEMTHLLRVLRNGFFHFDSEKLKQTINKIKGKEAKEHEKIQKIASKFGETLTADNIDRYRLLYEKDVDKFLKPEEIEVIESREHDFFSILGEGERFRLFITEWIDVELAKFVYKECLRTINQVFVDSKREVSEP
ncbi:MAG: hypothetical protein GOU98_03140 [Candidatus Altiarchaeota archaeon]|nr:hypothetical protein [Candidatus Altiarchaeota archaeon]